MICRYFNLSFRDIEEWLPWDEYFILMAVALDLDELDKYWQYVLAGGEPKKFKWSSPDKAGTVQAPTPGRTPQEKIRNIFDRAARGFTKGAVSLDGLPKGGTAADFFRVMNRPKIQRLEYPDGTVEYRDMNGELVEAPEGAAFAVVSSEDG